MIDSYQVEFLSYISTRCRLTIGIMQIEAFLDLLLSLIQWASSSQGNVQSPATILLTQRK